MLVEISCCHLAIPERTFIHGSYVLNKYVRRVGLRREAVVADIDTGIGHSQSVHIERIKAIRVLGQRRSVGRNGVDVNIVEYNVLGSHEKRRPARRIFQVETRDLNVRSVVSEKEDRAIVFVFGIKDLCAREAIPPGLSVAIENTGAINLDVPIVVSNCKLSVECLYLLATPYPKCNTFLEVVVEVVGLPILDVICELSILAMRCSSNLAVRSTYLQLAI